MYTSNVTDYSAWLHNIREPTIELARQGVRVICRQFVRLYWTPNYSRGVKKYGTGFGTYSVQKVR